MKERCDVCLERLPSHGVLGINTSGLVGGFGMVTFRADTFDKAAHCDAAVCGPRCAAVLYQMKLAKATGVRPAKPSAMVDSDQPTKAVKEKV